ncbi:MAG: hypothetical protein ACFCD0_28585 [Gemmataceae bacterium]
MQSDTANPQCLADKVLTASDQTGLHSICTGIVDVPSELMPLMEKWSTLSEVTRKAILALSEVG